jgi:hypothetical protein
MVAYGIGILLLMRCLKQEFPGVKQPWYANSAGTGAPFPVLYHIYKPDYVIVTWFGQIFDIAM